VFSFSDFERFADETGVILGEQFAFYPELYETELEALGDKQWMIRGDAFVELVRFGEIPGWTQAIMFRRSQLGELRFDTTLRICEDMHFVLRAALQGTVCIIPEVLAAVRRHDANTTTDFSGIVLDKLHALQRLRPFVEDDHQCAALEARISRAHFDAARYHLGRGHHAKALESWRAAIETPASPLQKLRSTVGCVRTAFLRTAA
jgi:hypothetical protein